MEWLHYVINGLLAVLGLGCLVVTAIGLPGNWILLGLALVVELTDHLYLGQPTETFGWWALGGCTALLLVGEAVEMATGAAGTKMAGGTRRGMTGAIVGGILGAILLTGFIPIPVIGTLVGALVGTFAGALLAERSQKDRGPEHTLEKDVKAATGATIGRLLGTFAKTGLGLAVWLMLVVLAFWPRA